MFKRESNRIDWGFFLIVGLVAMVAVWLLLTPIVPSVASSSMHRFHLRSKSFMWWSVQQPIPTMYNFSNQYEVTEIPPDLVDPLFADESKRHYINHFPARVLTWSSYRRHLRDQKDRWYTLETTYRGQKLRSRIRAKANGKGGFDIIRLPDQEVGDEW